MGLSIEESLALNQKSKWLLDIAQTFACMNKALACWNDDDYTMFMDSLVSRLNNSTSPHDYEVCSRIDYNESKPTVHIDICIDRKKDICIDSLEFLSNFFSDMVSMPVVIYVFTDVMTIKGGM